MFRDIINKGKEIADKVTNIVMNFTEVEAKVREATSDEAWGPHGRLMNEIAEYTYSHSTFIEVMGTLWKRLHTENARNWRRVYKSLILLDFLLKNGSEQVLSAAREHIYDIRTLESFHYLDEYGKDQGINVRIKVKEVINLIQDPDKLREERAKAKANRHLYASYGGSNRGGWGNFNEPYYGSRYADRDYDCNDTSPNASRYSTAPRHDKDEEYRETRVSRAPMPQQKHQTLGSFDEWHVGRERGLVDDVIEQIREAWDVAKFSTKDMFFKKDSEVDRWEANPRMVSEELYEFPQEAVEVDGTFDSDANPSRSEPRYNSRSTDQPKHQPTLDEDFANRDLSPIHRRRAVKPSDSSARVEVFEHNAQVASKPRPPSTDLMGSWEELQAAPSTTAAPTLAPSSDPVIDLFGLTDNVNQGAGWPGSTGPSQQSQWPSSQSATANANVGAGSGNQSLLDNDFSEFLTANQSTSNAIKPQINLASLAGSAASTTPSFAMGSTSVPFMTPSTTSQWPISQNGTTISTVSTSQAPEINLFTNGSKPMTTASSSPSQTTTNTTKPNPAVQIGSTWKELDALGINLDTLAQPERINQRTAPGPSLRQLQQTKQNLSSPPLTAATPKPGQSSTIAPARSNPMHPALSAATFPARPTVNSTPHSAVPPASQNLADFNLI